MRKRRWENGIGCRWRVVGDGEWKRVGTSPIGDNVEDRRGDFASSAVFLRELVLFLVLSCLDDVQLEEGQCQWQWLTLELVLPARSAPSSTSLRTGRQGHGQLKCEAMTQSYDRASIEEGCRMNLFSWGSRRRV